MTDTIRQMLLDFLHITQEPDKSTERRIADEAAGGIKYIRDHCDPDATCEPGTEYAQLLCEYVLRAESGALAEFKLDFAQEITEGGIATDVKNYAEAMGYDQESEG